MKKIMLLALLFPAAALPAQRLKDKLNAITETATGTSADKSNDKGDAQATAVATTGNESQFVMIENFTKAKKLFQTRIEKAGKPDVSPAPFTVADFFGKTEQNATGQITKFKEYSANHATYPTCYVYDGYTYIFINELCFTFSYCKVRSAADVDGCLIPGEVVRWATVYATSKSAAAGLTYESAVTILKNYFTEAGKGIETANASAKAAADKAADEKRAKYSIKGKQVKTIKIVFGTEKTEMRYKEQNSFKVVATLQDGSTLTAGDGTGFFDDYTIDVSGCSPEQALTGTIYNAFVYSPDDKITVKVTSKHHPALSDQKSMRMKYEAPAGETFSFRNNRPYNGDPGNATRVEMKQVKDANTGEVLIAYQVFNIGETKPLWAFKCKPETPVSVNCDGNNGSSGYSNGASEKTPENGKRGGNGGDIKVITDPSVTVSPMFTYTNRGGKGGKAGHTKYGNGVAGQDGSDGRVETVKQKVNW